MVSRAKPAVVPVAITPETPLRALKGVGATRADALDQAGLHSLRDLLWYFPNRYEDRRQPARIGDLRGDASYVVLRGRVVSCGAKTSPVKRFRIFEALLDDGSGTIMLVWFNQPYLSDQIQKGDWLSVYGLPKFSPHGRLQMDGPDWEKIEFEEAERPGEIVPIYPKIANVPPKSLRTLIDTALDSITDFPDPLPPSIRERLGVIDLHSAVQLIHRPDQLDERFFRQRSPAHVRIITQEFFSVQLALRVRRAREEVALKTRRIEITDAIRDEVRRILPFKLTRAQKRVLKEIADDLLADRPMYRLLQGDVGSGKTIVALIAAIIAIRNGHQVALLAPTEILVEQHYQRIRQLLGDNVRVARATGSMAAGERRTLLAGLRTGYIQLAVGTHALLEDRVTFESLALAIIDEQHRFGVAQRQRLFQKGSAPDVLVMTATPIPRSLALALYGDLELSVIDELPPGRQEIKTRVRIARQLDRVFAFADQEIAGGAQIYIVFPIIEESEKLNLKPLSQGFELIQQRFPGRRVAMLHGRMSSADKDETMQRFKGGEIDILVATTVIEVGIDVPNASIMLIFDADRFGLSQLHQLRGRVGRGERQSYCILISSDETNPESAQRLDIFASTRDGFDVAERDLQLRGPGEFLGTRQSGSARFRFGNILRDHELLERARDTAIELIAKEGVEAAETIVHGLLGLTLAPAERD
jgi:ATP-dependent DNA helicase RecG